MAEETKEPGRPPMYETPEELEDRVKAYFGQFKKDSQVTPELGEWRPTITGLSLFLGFESRQSFYAYEKKEAFSYTIKRARHLIENVYENMLGGQSTTGAIFALKNFDWSDKSEMDITTGGQAFILNVKPDEI